MTDILNLVFKTFRAQSDLAAVDLESPAQAPARSVLLVGDPALSRSLLLLASVIAASESGLRVIFLTQTQIQNLPVSLQKRVPSLNPASLKKIKFSYPRTLEELLVHVAGLHQSPNSTPSPPALIIVDGMEGYLCNPIPSTSSGLHTCSLSSASHLSALLCDTASFLSQVLERQGSAPCHLIASYQLHETSEQNNVEPSADPVLEVLDRYFLVRCTLDQDRSYEATSGGLQQVWNIYLSRLGITMSSCKKEALENPQVPIFQEWKLMLSSDGLMEFIKAQNTEKY